MAQAKLPHIVIGRNAPIDEGVRREDGRDAISNAGGTPALRPPRDTLPHIVIGGLGREDEEICRAERRSALHGFAMARPTLPHIVIGGNDPIDEGMRREDGRDAVPKAGGTPALRPPRDTLPHIVIGGLGQEGEEICGAERRSALQGFPMARPTLPHIVIGGLGREDEEICGAERRSALQKPSASRLLPSDYHLPSTTDPNSVGIRTKRSLPTACFLTAALAPAKQ